MNGNDDYPLWKSLYKFEDVDDVKEFQTWFDPIERYIHRKLEEPKIEKEQ